MVLLNAGIIPASDALAQGITTPMIVIAAFGPMMGAFVSLRSLNGKGAIRKYVKSFLSLKFGWKAWILMFAVLGLSSCAAWLIPELFGANRYPPYMPVYMFPPYVLLMVFFGGGQEEIGWRGYISPLLEKKFGLIAGSLILGIVWGMWHIPLWFIPGTGQSSTPFPAFILLTIGLSYFFSWIVEASGRRLFSALVAHGVSNSFGGLFPFLIMENGIQQTRYWIYAGLIFLTGITIVLVRSHKWKT
jgi:membrane protease YdiL (CAAX protease family)